MKRMTSAFTFLFCAASLSIFIGALGQHPKENNFILEVKKPPVPLEPAPGKTSG